MPKILAQFTLQYSGVLDMGEIEDDNGKPRVPNIDTIRARIAREISLAGVPEDYTLGSTNTSVQLQEVPTEAELEDMRRAQAGLRASSGIVAPGGGPLRRI